MTHELPEGFDAAERHAVPAAQSPAVQQPAGGEVPWLHMHPLSPLLKGGIFLLVIFGIIIANFRDRFIELFIGDRFWDDYGNGEHAESPDPIAFLWERGLILIALGVLLGIVALVVVISWISWRFATYRVTEDVVEERKGVLFRSHRRAPLERIQSVNLQRPLVARVLGLTKIEIVTAGQGGKVDLAYLNYQLAKAVRQEILTAAATKRQGSAAEDSTPLDATNLTALGQPTEASGPPVLWQQDAPDPAHRRAEGASAAAGASGQFGSRIDVELTNRANDFIDADIDPMAITEHTLVRVPVPRLIASIALSWEMVTVVGIAAMVILGAAVIDPALLFGIFPLAVVMVGVMIGQFNKGFNFTLSRGHDTVRTGAGLTSTLTETIPFGRIHAVAATQPLMWRGLGWWKVRITTAGHSAAQAGQNGSQNIVLPVGTIADVLRVFETLLPGLGNDPRDAEELRNGLTGTGEGYLGAGRKAGWLLWFGRRRSGIAIVDAQRAQATLRIRRGFLTRSLSVMPVVRAQSMQLSRPMVHYWLGLATLQAHTVLGPVVMQVRGVDLERARACFDETTACMLRVQGDESAERIAVHQSLTNQGAADVSSE